MYGESDVLTGDIEDDMLRKIYNKRPEPLVRSLGIPAKAKAEHISALRRNCSVLTSEADGVG
jgi:hypothetical protein